MAQLRPAPPKKETVVLDPLVEVLVLEAMTANFEVHSQGTVLPRTETVLSAEVSGTITSISPKFVAGGVFDKNEVLMRIDPTNYEVAVKQAEALVKQRADRTRRRRRSCAARDTAPKPSLRRLPLHWRPRKPNSYGRSATSSAPIFACLMRASSGAKEADLGQFVNPGTRLGVMFCHGFRRSSSAADRYRSRFCRSAGNQRYRVLGRAVDGPSVVLSAIQKGRPAEWPARIVRTEGVVDEKSRVTYVVARIEDPYRRHTEGNELPVGTFVQAKIEGTVAENVIRIPRAVVRGSDQVVFVDDENKIRVRYGRHRAFRHELYLCRAAAHKRASASC